MWMTSQAKNSIQVKQCVDHKYLGKLKMAQYSQYVKCSVGRGQVEDRQGWRWDRVLIIEDSVNKTLPTQFI